jgi:hypothetical protein
LFVKGGGSTDDSDLADTRIINPARTEHTPPGIVQDIAQLTPSDTLLSGGDLQSLKDDPKDLIIIAASATQIKHIIPQLARSDAPRPQMIVAVNVDRPLEEGGNFLNTVSDDEFATSDLEYKHCVMFPAYYQPKLTRWDMTLGNTATMDDVKAMNSNAPDSSPNYVFHCTGTERECNHGVNVATGAKLKFDSMTVDKYTAHLYSGLDWIFNSFLRHGSLLPAYKNQIRSVFLPALCSAIVSLGTGAVPYIIPTAFGHYSGVHAFSVNALTKPCRSLTWKMTTDSLTGKSTKPMMMEQIVCESVDSTTNQCTNSSHKIGGQLLKDIDFFLRRYSVNVQAGLPSFLFPNIQTSSIWRIRQYEEFDNPLYLPLATEPKCKPWNKVTSASETSTTPAVARRLGISSSFACTFSTLSFYMISLLWLSLC